MIKELQLVFTVKDEVIIEELGFAYTPKYTRVIIKLLQCHKHKGVNLLHRIVIDK